MKLIQNLMVGTLFFGALSVVGYFTILSENGPLARRGKQMVMYFDNADGIKIGSKVTILGVPGGTVQDVALVAVDRNNNPVKNDSLDRVGQRVAITIEIRQPIVFYENYKIAVKSESLLSDKLIAIDPGVSLDRKTNKQFRAISVFSVTGEQMEEYRKKGVMRPLDVALTQEPGGNPSKLKTRAFEDLKGETAGDPIAGISRLIEDNRENVRKTITNIAEITAKINNGKGTVGMLINEDELHRSAHTLLTDAQVVIK